VSEAETILEHDAPVDLDRRAAEYRAGGWSGFERTLLS